MERKTQKFVFIMVNRTFRVDDVLDKWNFDM